MKAACTVVAELVDSQVRLIRLFLFLADLGFISENLYIIKYIKFEALFFFSWADIRAESWDDARWWWHSTGKWHHESFDKPNGDKP